MSLHLTTDPSGDPATTETLLMTDLVHPDRCLGITRR